MHAELFVPINRGTESEGESTNVGSQLVRCGNAASVRYGCVGSTLITLGSFGYASVLEHDPILQALHLSWLRYGHGFLLSSVFFWSGIFLYVAAWIRLGRSAYQRDLTISQLTKAVIAWSLPLLIAVPLYSRDAYSYLAQGSLLRVGLSPYQYGPVAYPGTILDNVSSVWTTTTAPYGPLFMLICKWVTMLTGQNVIAGTLVLRLVMLPGLGLMLWSIPRIARHFGLNDQVALWLGVLGPITLIHLIGGVHNELLMVGLLSYGVLLVLRGKHGWGIAVITTAAAIKATAGVALPFMTWVWIRRRLAARYSPVDDGSRLIIVGAHAPLRAKIAEFARAVLISLAIFIVLFTFYSAVAGVGIGWATALGGSVKIINWLTVPTQVAQLICLIAAPLTTLTLAPVLAITRAIFSVVLAVTLIILWWLCRRNERTALAGTLWGLLAVCLLSPATLPWYYTWPLAMTASVHLRQRTLAIIVGLSTWIMVIFAPNGSIGFYVWWHVLLAFAVAGLAGWSFMRVDPLRVGSLLGRPR